MSVLMWFIEGLAHWCVYFQITMDTGWFHAQFERMPHIQREIHSRLVTWLSEKEEK